MFQRSTTQMFGAIAITLLLAACGGGGGGGPIDPIDPIPPNGGGNDPTPPLSPARGISAIPGIGQIPIDQIKTTNSQMKEMFVVSEQTDPTTNWHTAKVREVACNSYTLQCDNSESFHGQHRNADRTVTATTGSAPYTSITDNYVSDRWTWLNSQMDSMANLKIVSHSTSLANGRVATGATLPGFLVVQGAGNQGIGEDYDPLDGIHQPEAGRIRNAIAANKMLLVAGWSKDGNGNFVRHSQSASCSGIGVSEGCLWAQFDFPGIGSGTSLSTPQVAAALASVLAVFPETEHQELAKFAKACARKTGNGIPVLLVSSGGVGVVDFTCMGAVSNALANLPTGGKVNVNIQGQNVAVEGRKISLSFISPAYFAPGNEYAGLDLRTSSDENPQSLTFRLIPTGEGSAMAVSTLSVDNVFVSLGIGTRSDFFGFTKGHEHGVRETRVTAGHHNFFAYLSSVWSEGGAVISSAKGKSAGLMFLKEFSLTEQTGLTVSARIERFLGGDARIGNGDVNFATVPLPEGSLHRFAGVSSKTSMGDGSGTVEFGTAVHFPENERKEFTASTRFIWAF